MLVGQHCYCFHSLIAAIKGSCDCQHRAGDLGDIVHTMACKHRHIFENRKYVEEYRTEDVEREMGLDQDGLIRLALLLGSDYTEGVGGIGIVNAVEVCLLEAASMYMRACVHSSA